MVKLVSSIVVRLLTIGLPPALAENIRRNAIVDVSFPAGNEDNVYTSHLQVDVSSQSCSVFLLPANIFQGHSHWR